MKVQIFSFEDYRSLEYYVNNFIAHHNVTNIQYQASIGDHNRRLHSAMVIYEDTGDEKGE